MKGNWKEIFPAGRLPRKEAVFDVMLRIWLDMDPEDGQKEIKNSQQIGDQLSKAKKNARNEVEVFKNQIYLFQNILYH